MSAGARHALATAPRPRDAVRPDSTRPAGPAGAAPGGRAGRGPTHDGVAPQARLHRLATGFAILFLEVEAGLRPRGLMRNFMCPVLYDRLSRVWVRSPRQAGQLVRLSGWLVADDSYEAVALVGRGERISAVAFHMRLVEGRWRVIDLARPEDGPLPPQEFLYPPAEADAFDLVLTPR